MIAMQIIGDKQVIQRLQVAKIRGMTAARLGLKAGALIIETEAKKNAPYRTGNLRRSITSGEVKQFGNDLGIEIGTDVEYAYLIEFGTPPHVIQVRDARVLTDGKGNFFGKKVMHPGTAPNPFLRKSLDEKGGEARAEIAKVIKMAFV